MLACARACPAAPRALRLPPWAPRPCLSNSVVLSAARREERSGKCGNARRGKHTWTSTSRAMCVNPMLRIISILSSMSACDCSWAPRGSVLPWSGDDDVSIEISPFRGSL